MNKQFTNTIGGGIMMLVASALMACSPQAAVTPTSQPETTPIAAAATAGDSIITVGDISDDDPTAIFETHQPLADYLAANLASAGITAGEVKVAPDMETMTEWIESGEVDLYFDSPYPAMIVSSASGAEPILRRWKGGVSEYTSVMFTLAANDVETLEDLNGDLIAFDEPYSTSGYMLPLSYILEADLNAVEKPDTEAEVADDEIGYVFSGDDENAVQWVVSEKVTAAVVDSTTFSEIPEETRSQLHVVTETEALPRHVVVISPTASTTLKDAVRTLMMAMDEAEDGQAVLNTFEETAQFDEFPDGAESALARMRELFDLVQEQQS